MDVFTSFATDQALENKGKWFTLAKDAQVLVARSGNDRYSEKLRAHMELSPLEGLNSKQQEEIGSEILVDVLAETVLLDWKGLAYQGKEVPYSKDMAKTFLRIKDFRKKINMLSENFEAFRVKAEAEQGNA